MHAIIYHVLFGLLNAIIGICLYLYGKHKGKRERIDPEEPTDCLKALAILRMNYDKEDGPYSYWMYVSLTYAIERIAEIDHINTYIGKERIPPLKTDEDQL